MRLRPGIKPRVPLERALSKLGIASRTQAREWILAGRVRVDERVVRDPLRAVVLESARIVVEGQEALLQAPRTMLLHKPKGVVATRADEKGRPTVFGLLKGIDTYLVAVGRLDFATTGLLLLTNDTAFSAWITDPRNAVPRVYLATVRGEFTAEKAQRLQRGIVDDGERLQASGIEIRKASGRESHLTLNLTEGKNREIRRMLASTGNEVTRLKRVSFGGLELGDLEPGKWREVSEVDLVAAFPGAPIRVR